MTTSPPSRTTYSTSLAHTLAATFDVASGSPWRTRFAPAPTGFLHLGHVANALHVWGIARAYGGEVLLRIEDHDRTRSRPDYERALLADLDWLGFTADIGTTDSFRRGRHELRQSDGAPRYEAALQHLAVEELHYGCTCSRRMIAEAQGNVQGATRGSMRGASPQQFPNTSQRALPNQLPDGLREQVDDAGELRYPGTCAWRRAGDLLHGEPIVARRFRVSDAAEEFTDLRSGAQRQSPALQCGDFLLRDRNGNFTYQLCVAVDDWEQRIDLVVRGEDLLSSTGRQMQLARALGRTQPMKFLHHPLLLRADGLKLSKSLGDTGVHELRAAGLTASEVLGRAAHACGLVERPVALEIAHIGSLFV